MKNKMGYLLVFLLGFAVLMSVVVFNHDFLNTKEADDDDPGGGGTGIVMLGDSLTFRTDWKSLLKDQKVVNRGINGNTTRDMFRRLEGIIELKPGICFIMGGINDISRGKPVEKIFENYRLIIDKLIGNGIRPVIQSTLFVTGDFNNSRGINDKVAGLNRRLETYGNENGISFIDLNRTLSDHGGLIAKFTVDGVHLSADGYEAWSRILISFLKQDESAG